MGTRYSARTPEISVVMATWNRADALEAAIASVLAQDFVELELVIVDDGSTDDTPDRLAAWASRDERVRVFRNDANRGLPASLNRGIAKTRAPLLARIDDDDTWSATDKLSRQFDWMQRRPEAVLLGTAYVDEWGRAITNPTGDKAIRRQILFRCPFCHSSVLMRAAAVAEAGGYDEGLPYAEDWDLWLRLGRLGHLGNLPEVMLVKARGEDTLSERYFQRQLAMAANFARRHGHAYPGSRRARAVHAFNRVFFAVVPVGGRLHRGMGRLFRRVFRLERGAP